MPIHIQLKGANGSASEQNSNSSYFLRSDLYEGRLRSLSSLIPGDYINRNEKLPVYCLPILCLRTSGRVRSEPKQLFFFQSTFSLPL